MKDYLLKLICACAPDDGFAQDAIEYAITWGWVTPGYENIQADTALIRPHYDAILARYRAVCDANPTVHPLFSEILSRHAP